MDLQSVFETLTTAGVVGIIVFIFSLIKIKPLEINFWQWLARGIGKAFNHDLFIKLEEIEKKQDVLERKNEEVQDSLLEHKADEARTRILRFGDEMIHDTRHSHDSWIQIMRDIKAYQTYCEDHTEYENNVTGPTCQRITEVFTKHIDDENFFV